ncbi:MAG TPA: MBL fold metallo-hydrolase [Candidatus Polarisedimenticolia bacterium]|nr:MBL fold metallo-hydrolase [Candidatus Polarisedimenticolia bacterium]
MARVSERLPDNADGEFYVDRSCIDCDTCTRVAPGLFAAASDHSFVSRQPRDDDERLRALMALVSCPTASIGTVSRLDTTPGVAAFPEPVAEEVSFLGFTSEDSFGAWSYLVRRPAGNVIVDSPRAAAPLMKRIEQMGGARLMFLTHRDDVAEHAAFRRRFGCARVLHADDVTAATRDVERRLEGPDPVRLDDDLLAIPVPGHTRGHSVLLYRDRFLFTGDHLAWSEKRRRLVAFRDACWYSWTEQTRSMERLLDHSFKWVLPGHGGRWHAPSAAAMRQELERCIAWMRDQG